MFAAVVATAEAQSPPSVSPKRLAPVAKPLAERFEGTNSVPVSGSLVVGLQLGEFAGKFAPENLQVALRTKPKSGFLCLSVASRDGRYSARNLYTAGEGAELAVFDFDSKHKTDILRYDAAVMAVLIRDAASCEGPDPGVLLPRRIDGTRIAEQLLVAVNAPAEKTRAILLRGEAEIAQAACQSDPTQVSMAFAALCRLKASAPLADGGYTLRVTVRERFETVPRDYAVRIESP